MDFVIASIDDVSIVPAYSPRFASSRAWRVAAQEPLGNKV